MYAVPTHLGEREPFAFGRTVGEMAKLVAIGFVAAQVLGLTNCRQRSAYRQRSRSSSSPRCGRWSEFSTGHSTSGSALLSGTAQGRAGGSGVPVMLTSA
jgi:hypothetical protein